MTDSYIHGFSADEQARLTRMQSLLNDAQVAAMEWKDVRRVLDVGSGLGQLTRAMARRLGQTGTVIGVEQSEDQLLEARRQAELEGESALVEFRRGSAVELPLQASEYGSFDLVHARFLLEHVSDPLRVVKQMVRAARVGGQIVLMDDDHDLLRLWPPCQPAQRAWEVYWRSYYEIGLDPLVGRRMGELLYQCGLRRISVQSIFYGAHAGNELFEPVVDNLIGVIQSASSLLESRNLFSRSEMQKAMNAIGEWRKNPVACLWYSLPMATGIKER